MTLTVTPLTWDLCMDLAPATSPGDVLEVSRQGHTPLQALATALFMATVPGAEAFAVITPEGRPRGAFGYTCHGAIWSLWATLTRAEKMDVVTRTPEWVAYMVSKSPLHARLENLVDVENKPVLDWLRHAGCFHVDEDHPDMRYGVPFYRFWTVT